MTELDSFMLSGKVLEVEYTLSVQHVFCLALLIRVCRSAGSTGT